MSILARFQAIEDKDKAAVVRTLISSSTPSFDFFYITALAVAMATLGLLLGSTSIVIGSMLIAPVLYPILAFGLGLVMSDPVVIGRSFLTLIKSFGLGIGIAIVTTFLFAEGSVQTYEVMSRTEPSLLHFMVAVLAGAAVAFALSQPEWSETLPGIAISVALIPPLAVIGIGIATLDTEIVSGSAVLLLINLLGIVFAAMVTFLLMNLYEKQNIAVSTLKRESERLEAEQQSIAEIDESLKQAKQQ